MKKAIAIILAVVTLLTVLVMPVSATSVDTGTISSSMTEDEFRSYSSDMNFSLQNSMILQSSAYSSYDYSYYYDVLRSKYSNSFEYAAYNAAATSFDGFTSGTWEFTFTTDYLNGQYYSNSQTSQFYKLANEILNHAMVGGWCYRYDNILECDRFTNTVSSNMWFDLNYSNQVTKSHITVYCVDHTYYNTSEIAQRDAAIDKIVATANTKSNSYEMLKYVHDTLIRGADYDYDALSANYDSRRFYYAHSSIGVLIKGEGVCESYAKAFKEVCDRLSIFIPVAVLTSNTHMWNIVYLDNKWYCVDATWDDLGGSQIDYTYFLCGDPDKIDGTSTDHVPDGIYTDAPTYASESYNPNKATSGWKIIGGKKYYYENGAKVTGWKTIDGYRYYFDASSVMQTGWKQIGSIWYFFEESGMLDEALKRTGNYVYTVTGGEATFAGTTEYISGDVTIPSDLGGYPVTSIGDEAFAFCTNITSVTIPEGVESIGYDAFNSCSALRSIKLPKSITTIHNYAFYACDSLTDVWYDGTAAETKWIFIGSQGNGDLLNATWHYKVVKGWQRDANGWRYGNADGSYITSNWLYGSGCWYYFNALGYMVTDWANIGGTWYYFDGLGIMKTGWANIGGTWYYFEGSGAMKTGWLYDGVWYYFDASGAMKTDWANIGGTWYFFDGSGAMRTGWAGIGGVWYYFHGSGAMATGWVNIGGAWYYFYGSGAMHTGWLYDGAWYYFYSDGAMATNIYIDGGYIDASGVWR